MKELKKSKKFQRIKSLRQSFLKFNDSEAISKQLTLLIKC